MKLDEILEHCDSTPFEGYGKDLLGWELKRIEVAYGFTHTFTSMQHTLYRIGREKLESTSPEELEEAAAVMEEIGMNVVEGARKLDEYREQYRRTLEAYRERYGPYGNEVDLAN